MPNVSGKQSVGERDNQEDALRFVLQSEQDPNSDILMLLADGMGGHVGGEIASNLALQSFENHFVAVSRQSVPADRLAEALDVSNRQIERRIAQEPELRGMGCTLIGALKRGDRLQWISVGDSLLYLFRRGSLRRLNADHSLYGELLELVAAGKMTQAEADAHPRRNALRSALIGAPLSLTDLNSVALERGDLVILASDGIETLSPARITEILRQEGQADPGRISSALIREVEAQKRPHQDNTTVIVYRHDRTGESGIYGDSKWRMSLADGRGVWMSLPVLGALGAMIVLLLGMVIYLVGFGGEDAPVAARPAAGEAGALKPIGGDVKSADGAAKDGEKPVIPAPDSEAPANPDAGPAEGDKILPDGGAAPDPKGGGAIIAPEAPAPVIPPLPGTDGG
ncbi:MAG: protein phosphatase 2C domain-containing protein [Rhodobacteraceae bacterium]|nr:protein phosphatase 2C domain-containing protein [Paracoccaceae bacterium]